MTPWFNWSQLRDPFPWDVLNATYDCGPESVAECVAYLTGVQLEAEYIKGEMYNAQYVGYTDIVHLAGYLENKCAIPVQTYSGNAQTKLQPIVQKALSLYHPVIVLFFWDLQKLTGGHFCPVIACDEKVVTRSNPWTGATETWSWAHFEMFQQMGVALELKRKRSILV